MKSWLFWFRSGESHPKKSCTGQSCAVAKTQTNKFTAHHDFSLKIFTLDKRKVNCASVTPHTLWTFLGQHMNHFSLQWIWHIYIHSGRTDKAGEWSCWTLARKTIADETPPNTSIRQVCQLSSLQRDPQEAKEGPHKTQSLQMRRHSMDYCVMSSQTRQRQGMDEEHVWVMSTRTVK